MTAAGFYDKWYDKAARVLAAGGVLTLSEADAVEFARLATRPGSSPFTHIAFEVHLMGVRHASAYRTLTVFGCPARVRPLRAPRLDPWRSR